MEHEKDPYWQAGFGCPQNADRNDEHEKRRTQWQTGSMYRPPNPRNSEVLPVFKKEKTAESNPKQKSDNKIIKIKEIIKMQQHVKRNNEEEQTTLKPKRQTQEMIRLKKK